MAGAVMNKIYDLFGIDRENTEYEEDEKDFTYEYAGENIDEEDDEVNDRKIFGKKNKVVNMNQGQQIRMIIVKPTSFDQSEQICECLKEKKSIIVNLEYVNKDVARRIVDFMSGAVQALDGHIEKVSNSIFLFAPFNYEISNETTREEIKNKLSVSWIKNG